MSTSKETVELLKRTREQLWREVESHKHEIAKNLSCVEMIDRLIGKKHGPAKKAKPSK